MRCALILGLIWTAASDVAAAMPPVEIQDELIEIDPAEVAVPFYGEQSHGQRVTPHPPMCFCCIVEFPEYTGEEDDPPCREYLTGTLVDSYASTAPQCGYQNRFLHSLHMLVALSVLLSIALALALEWPHRSGFRQEPPGDVTSFPLQQSPVRSG